MKRAPRESTAGWPRFHKVPYTPTTPQLLHTGQLTVDRTISLYVICFVIRRVRLLMICFNTASHSKLLQTSGVSKHRTGPKHRSRFIHAHISTYIIIRPILYVTGFRIATYQSVRPMTAGRRRTLFLVILLEFLLYV